MKKLLLITSLLASFVSGLFAQTQFSCSNGTDSVVYDVYTTDMSCYNLCDGSAFVQVSSGNPDFVQWLGPNGFSQSGAGLTNVSGLCQGTYTVVVNDVTLGISCTGQFVINSPSFLVLSASSTNETSPGANDGTVNAVTTGGTPGYMYELYLNGNVISTNTTGNFSGLAPGNYMICVTDVNGCQTCENNLLVQSSCNLINTANPINEVCAGSCDGAIFVSSTNGLAPYMASIDGGANWSTYTSTYAFQNLCAGTYVVDIVDANGCPDVITVVVASGSTFQAQVQVDAHDTLSNCTGEMSAYTTGNPGTIVSYEWVDCNTGTSFNTTPSVSGLCTGAYQVIITNSSGCVDTSSCDSVALVNGSCNLGANIDVYHETCMGMCDGSFNVTPINGTAPYTISVSGSGTQTVPVNAIFNLMCSGTYQIDVVDANGCTYSYVEFIIPGTQFFVNTQVLAQDTAGNCTGEITAAVSGTPYTPLTYQWQECGTGTIVSSNQNAVNLCEGSYYVTVMDANGCVQPSACDSVLLVSGSCNLGANIDVYHETCMGMCDGSLNVTPTNGAAPYTISINGSASQTVPVNAIFNMLCSGTYQIDVVDANGCTYSYAEYVIPGSQFFVNTQVLAQDTLGNCTGEITSLVTGTPFTPLTYLWQHCGTGTVVSSSQNAGNLCQGSYYVTVTDANGCVQSSACDSVLLINTSCNLNAVATANYTTCDGICDGLIVVSTFNGTAPFTYILDGTTTIMAGSSGTFSNVCYGAHNVDVIDANGCSTSVTVYVWANQSITINHNGATNETAPGASDGTLSFGASGGTSPYTFTLTDGGGSSTSNTSGNFNGLSTGWYEICAVDSIGCENCDSAYVGLNNGGCNITANAIVQPETCPGACDGVIIVDVFGGAVPYIVTVNGSMTQTVTSSAYFSNICAGVYQIDIVDANGCTYFIPAVTVWNSSNLSLTQTNMTNESSNGANDGTLSFSATGGASPYTFNLAGATNTTGNFNGLSEGWYSICVTDNMGCQVCDSAYVGLDSVNCNITATATVFHESCPGSCDGMIQIDIFGGTLPYIVMLNGTTTQTATSVAIFNGICTSVNQIHIQDANGCTFFIPAVTVGSNSNLTLTQDGMTNESSSGQNDGTLSFTANGGTSPYTYNLGGALNTTGDFNALSSGWYSICVTDSLGCQVCDSAYVGLDSTGACNISVLPYIVSSPTNGNCNGALSATINGTSGNYNAYWIDCATGNITYTWYQWSSACPGSYALVVEDITTGCVDTSDCINVIDSTSNCNHLVVENVVHASCNGTCDGMIVVTSNGPSPVYTWNNGATGSTITGLCPGVYCVTVEYSDSCIQTYCYTVGGNSTLSASYQVNNETSSGVMDGLIVVTTTGGTPGYEYSINGGSYVAGNNVHTFGNLGTGYHWVCVRDSAGCEVCDSVYVGVGTGIGTQSTFDVDIYPNPNNGAFTIILPADLIGDSEINLTDVSGRLIWQSRTNQTKTQVSLGESKLSKGIYIVNITNENRRASQRIVIH